MDELAAARAAAKARWEAATQQNAPSPPAATNAPSAPAWRDTAHDAVDLTARRRILRRRNVCLGLLTRSPEAGVPQPAARSRAKRGAQRAGRRVAAAGQARCECVVWRARQTSHYSRSPRTAGRCGRQRQRRRRDYRLRDGSCNALVGTNASSRIVSPCLASAGTGLPPAAA